MQGGELIASGRTSDVFAQAPGRVVKVLRPGVPDDWAQLEAHATAAVRRLGLPVPEVFGVVDVDGRPGIVFERIFGPSMWQQMLDEPHRVPELTAQLAAVQQQIQSAGIPEGIPDLVRRMVTKLCGLEQLSEAERDEACAIAEALPRGAALLHGDLHPGNLLMSERGAVVIDWFDAAIGHPVADVVRSSILLRPGNGDEGLPHLPFAADELLAAVHATYVDAFADALGHDRATVSRWEAVVAASRLVEGAQADETTLIELWRERSTGVPSPALAG